MKKNVVIEVPIASRRHINLPAPCTYCGKQCGEAGTKEWKRFYTLKHWGPGRKSGNMQLWETKHMDGAVKKGNVTIHAPYCPQHKEGIPLFGTVKTISIVGLALAGIILGVWNSGLDDSNSLIIRLVIIAVFLIMGASLGILVSWAINGLLGLIKPEFSDFPTIESGHWGLSFGQPKVDPGEHGVGPVDYILRLGFLNVESAQRFLAAYPDGKVVKGKDLIRA